MKNLIIYLSHHGTTEKVSREIAGHLEGQTEIIKLSRKSKIDLVPYELVIIGGSIHAGQIQKEIKRFCTKHKTELLSKKLGLFICYMDKNNGQEEFEQAFDEDLRNHAIAHGLMGGEFLFEKMNFVEKLLVKKIAGISESKSDIDNEAIINFNKTLIKESDD